MSKILELLTSLVDASKIGGWVRAAAATVLGALAVKYGPALADWVSIDQLKDFAEVLAGAAAAIAVGIWSQLTKKTA